MGEKKKVSILGSTGSIGRQSLEVIKNLGYEVTALTGNKNIGLLEEQIREFRPALAAVPDESAAKDLRIRLADTGVKIASGEGGLIDAAELSSDILISSVVGTAGLRPTMAAVKCGGRRIALANKETLVCAGHLFMDAVKKYGAELIPVDSEHSAIFQCLDGRPREELKRILLTASGGPFANTPKSEFASITKERALRHPNWSMGAKITIDSATMMNKGLEVIEAMHLFGVSSDKIHVLIHPQSVIHSMVEFCDNAVIAQLGTPDMRLPIQFALTYPERRPSPAGELDLSAIGSLTFSEPDLDKFSCLATALRIADRSDVSHAVMNAANEAAVSLFLEDRIGFTEIGEAVTDAVERLGDAPASDLDDVLAADACAREYILKQRI